VTTASLRAVLHGLYPILDPRFVHRLSLVEALKEAAAGGARLFQYRDKAASRKDAYRQAEQLRRAASDAGAVLIVNDRCDLALAVDADGVHLGQDDLPVTLARGVMGPNKLIGLSTHTAEQVTLATADKPDYVGFGPIFPTASKADHEPVVGVEGLKRVRVLTDLPMFAIGGIALEHAGSVMQAGADGVAVMSAIWSAPDISAAVRLFIEKIERASRPMNES
jgi:thiamine-phosphate pyrophosphorylase